jgi:hypothetical protein
MADVNRETSRRALIAGAAAGAAVVASEAIRAAPAQAADGDEVLLGRDNEAVNTTVITAKEAALKGRSNTDDGALVGENESPEGYGVRASSPYIGVSAVGGEQGVHGVSDYGTGVYAETYDGIALSARTAVPQGTALQVEGTAKFSRSGIAIVKAGRKEVTVTGVLLTSSSIVLATMQQYRSGSGISLRAAIPDPTSGSLRIRLTAAATEDTKVGWFVVN